MNGQSQSRPESGAFVIEPGALVGATYRLESLLGRGGMGSVWRAAHVRLGHRVAIKIIAPMYAQLEEARRRFDNEAKAAAALRSRHIVQVFDNGELDDGTPFIVMEYLEGQPLSARLGEGRAMAPAEAFAWLSQIGRALAVAHAAGVVHRDLKPENIFLARSPDEAEPVAKVLDFGIAKFNTEGFENGATQTGAVMGTPVYMSPEQARGLRTVDHRSDLYSLGQVAYTLLTGKTAFQGGSLADVIIEVCTQPLPSLRALAPWLPEALEGWYRKACAREPAERFGGVGELLDAFSAAAQAPPGGPPRAPMASSTTEIASGAPAALAYLQQRGAAAGAKAAAVPPPFLPPGASWELPTPPPQAQSWELSTPSSSAAARELPTPSPSAARELPTPSPSAARELSTPSPSAAARELSTPPRQAPSWGPATPSPQASPWELPTPSPQAPSWGPAGPSSPAPSWGPAGPSSPAPSWGPAGPSSPGASRELPAPSSPGASWGPPAPSSRGGHGAGRAPLGGDTASTPAAKTLASGPAGRGRKHALLIAVACGLLGLLGVGGALLVRPMLAKRASTLSPAPGANAARLDAAGPGSAGGKGRAPATPSSSPPATAAMPSSPSPRSSPLLEAPPSSPSRLPPSESPSPASPPPSPEPPPRASSPESPAAGPLPSAKPPRRHGEARVAPKPAEGGPRDLGF